MGRVIGVKGHESESGARESVIHQDLKDQTREVGRGHVQRWVLTCGQQGAPKEGVPVRVQFEKQNQEEIYIKRFIRRQSIYCKASLKSEGQAGILEYRVKLLPQQNFIREALALLLKPFN